MLGRRVGAQERRPDFAADRADVDDPPLGSCKGQVCAEQRREGSRDGEHSDQVHLDLLAEVGDRLNQWRVGQGHAGVVHQPIQGAARQAGPHRDG